MKRLLALVLILCSLPVISLAASNPNLPSFQAYCKNQLDLIETQEKDFLIMEKYSGSQAKISAIAEAYSTLLTEEYDLWEVASFQVDYGTYKRANYALVHSDLNTMGSFSIYNDDYNWRCDCQVFLQYNIVDSGNSTLWIYYRPEFNYQDWGDRYSSGNGGSSSGTSSIFANLPTARPTAKPTAKPTARPTATPTPRPTATPKPARNFSIDTVYEMGDGQVQIRWTDSANNGPYDVYYVRKLSGSLENDREAQGWNWVSSSINNKYYTIGKFIPGQDYWVWIKDSDGNTTDTYIYYAGALQHFNDFKQKPSLKDVELKQVNASGQKSSVKSFSANTIKNSLDQMDFGAYVAFDYPRFKDEKHYYFQVALEAPDGWAYVDANFSNTLPAGDHYSYWTFYSFDDYFANLIESHGYMPTGRYTFKMFWDGKLVDTATFNVN